jgi:MFS family permease
MDLGGHGDRPVRRGAHPVGRAATPAGRRGRRDVHLDEAERAQLGQHRADGRAGDAESGGQLRAGGHLAGVNERQSERYGSCRQCGLTHTVYFVYPLNKVNGARVALTAFFAVHGFIFANWAVRVPAVKQQTGASPGELGLALLGLSIGAVTTMVLAGLVCRRFGAARVTIAGCALLSLALLLPPRATSAVTLGLGLLVFGAAYGSMNVAMNAVAVDQVAALGRPVMPSYHAAWSFGGLAGAFVGGLLAPHLSPARHLALITVVGLIVTVVAGRALREPPAHAADATREKERGAVRLVGGLGLIALCAAYGEGAIGDWGALHLRQDLHVGAGLAAAGYAAFALAEASARLGGSTLLRRFGQTRVLVASGSTACAGAMLAALAPAAWLAIAGFAVTGAGVANLFPTAMARAGALAGSSGIAAASTLGYGGFLLGPPAIGFLAGAFGLPEGLTTIALLALVAAATGYLISAAPRMSGSCPGSADREARMTGSAGCEPCP